jgi:hypothetical protein
VADPAEVAFLASAAARAEEALSGLAWLAGHAARLPLPMAGLLALFGGLLLAVGARRRRVIGAVGGAAVGALAVLAASAWLRVHAPGLPLPALVAGGAAGLGALGALAPSTFVLGAGALPGAVLGVAAPIGDEPLLGLLAGAGALGGLALWMPEFVAAVTAATLGAGLLGGALLSLVAARAELLARPSLLLAWLVVVGAAGTAAQLGRAWGRGGRVGSAAGLTPPDRPVDRAARSPGSRP